MTQNNWVKDIDALIQDIDLNAKEIKYTEKKVDDTITSYSKSKLNKNYKTELITEDNNGWFFEYKVYQTKKEILAIFDFYNTPFYYKGYSTKERAILEIVETKLYFKNDSVGIEYIRRIDVFENENIDSLKTELRKKPFTNKPLNNVDYEKKKATIKRMRKWQ